MRKLLLALSLLLIINACKGNKKPGTASLYTPINQDSTAIGIGKPDFKTLKFEYEGKPCISVINNRYASFKNKSSFPLSLFITVTTIDKDEDGHPQSNEAKAFITLHDQILNSLDSLTNYCYIGHTTMNGYRDIMLYIKREDEKQITALLNNYKNQNKRFKSFVYEKDETWEAVADFYDAIK